MLLWFTCAYRFIGKLQQFVRESISVSHKFFQGLFKADSFFEDLIAAIHTHWVGRLE